MTGVKKVKKTRSQDSFHTCEVSRSGSLSPLPEDKGSTQRKKKNGSQNFLCKGCGKQVQSHYVYPGCVTQNKALVLRMLCRGSGIRDCAALTGVSKSAVLALIKKTAAGLSLQP